MPTAITIQPDFVTGYAELWFILAKGVYMLLVSQLVFN